MRVHGFDFLRGLCALMVATYHILTWSDAADFPSWGLYGVYIFFVLSGASMVVAYRERFARGLPAIDFMGMRVARLAPLYVAVLLVYAAIDRQRDGAYFLNPSFLFGLGNPGQTSKVTGGWSLGIEFAFYLMFPVFLSTALHKGRHAMAVLLVASQLVFVNGVVGGDLKASWSAYIQPLSFVAYFYLGCLIGVAAGAGVRTRAWNWLWMGVPFAVIVFGGGDNDALALTGWRGALLFGASIAAVYFSMGLGFGRLRFVAAFLGDISYGLYLLHPLVFSGVRKLNLALPVSLVLTLCVSGALARLSFQYFERPIRDFSRRLFSGAVPRPVA